MEMLVMKKFDLRMAIYEFIAFPAHIWLWICARLVGWEFECGPVYDENDSSD